MAYNPDEMLCDCGHPRKLHAKSLRGHYSKEFCPCYALYERIQKMKRRSISVLLAAVCLTGVISSALAKQRNTARLSVETLTVGSTKLGIGMGKDMRRPYLFPSRCSTKLGIGMGKDKVVSLLAQDGFQIVPVGSNTTSSKQERIKMLTFLK